MSESLWDDLAADAPSAETVERTRSVSASQAVVAAQPKPAAAPPSWNDLAADAPATQELLADPARAARVADDVPALAALEKVFGGSWDMLTGGIGDAAYRGGLNDRVAQIGYRQSQGWATPAELEEADRLERLAASIPRPEVGLVARGLRAAAESAPMMAGTAAEAGHETSVGAAAGVVAGAAAGSVAGGVGAVPGAAAGLLGGAGIGFRTGMTVAMGKREKGLAYREYMQIPGVTHEAAAFASTVVGAANGMLEVLPLDLVLQIPGFKALLRGGATRDVFRAALRSNTGRAAVARAAARLAGGMTLEGLTEAAQELSTILGGQAIDQTPGVTVDWARVGEAGLEGALAGGVYGAAGVGAGLTADVQEASRARQRAAFFTELGKAAAESKTIANLPDDAQAHIEAIQARQGGAVESVSAPAEKILELFQRNEITLEQVAKRMPAVARQLEEAAGNPGVEVSIPTAEFAVNIAPLPGYEGLVPDLRVGDELTLREAEKVEAEAKALAESEKGKEAGAVEATPEARVVADVAAKLEAAGQDEGVARTNAALWGAFARVMAKRTGAPDAFAFYESIGLGVGNAELQAEPGVQTLAQTAVSDSTVKTITETLRAKHPDVDFFLGRGAGGALVLMKIVAKERGKGLGSAFMSDLAALADEHDAVLAATPSPDFGGTKSRIVEFNKRFGFVANKGRKRDFAISETMYRQPKSTKLDQLGDKTVRGRASFPESREWFKVTLTGAANLSTFAHESGHVFLEIMRGYADVNEDLAGDLATVHEWLGVPLTGEFTEDQLERFARGFEAYLREGKAPSFALAQVFESFKSWLGFVYRTLRGLDVELTDEVRGVMDRMLATEAEIAQARQEAGLVPAFDTAEAAGMTPAEFEAYRARWAKVQEEGAQEILQEKLAGLARQIGDERAEVRAEVQEAADEEPVLRLREFLRTGETGGDEALEGLLEWARAEKAGNIVTTLERSKAARKDPRLARLRVLEAALGGDEAATPSRTRPARFLFEDGEVVGEHAGAVAAGQDVRSVVLPEWLAAADYLAERTTWDLAWTLVPHKAPRAVQALVADRIRAALAGFPTFDTWELQRAYTTAKLLVLDGAPTHDQEYALHALRTWLAQSEDSRPETPFSDQVWGRVIDTREGGQDPSWKWAQGAAADLEKGLAFEGEQVAPGAAPAAVYEGEEGALRKERDALHQELAAEQRVKVKLDHEAVAALVGTKGLARMRGFTARGGVSPDTVAPYFRFKDGAKMVQALATTSSREAWVRAETSRRMAEKYPEGAVVAKPDKVAAAVTQKGALKALEAEWRAMGKRLGRELPRTVMEAMRRGAKLRVASMTQLELTPEVYRRAARSAAREAVEGFVKASKGLKKPGAEALQAIEEALDAKRRQVWNTLLARETAAARTEAEKIRAYLRGFEDIRAQKRLGLAGTRYPEAMNALLAGLQLRRESARAVAKRASLARYVAEMEAEGDTVSPALKELSELKSYRTMTLDELRAVEAAAANIDAMARLKGKLLLRGERRDLARTAAELSEHIRAGIGAEAKPTPGDVGALEKSREWLRSADADMKKVEFIARSLDGGQTAGLAHRLIFQPLRDAQNARYLLQEQVHGALMKPFKELSLERRRRYAEKVGFLYSPKAGKMVSLARRNVLSVLLNLGNEGNRDRLLQGYGWTEAEVLARLDQLLDDGDLAIVEHIWKTVDSLWPAMKDLSERHVGLPPPRVEATPVTLPGGRRVSGGYYPIVKSRRMSYLGQQIAERDNALWEANFFAPVVEHGFTKSRGRDMSPLELSLDVVPSHLDKVIHYLTHYEAIRGVDRLVQQGDVRGAITEGLGAEYYNQIRPWLESIAADGNLSEPLIWYERLFRHLRFGSSVVLLFAKIPTGLKQGLGLFTSAKEVKRRHLVSGVRKFLAEGWGEVARESPEFKFIDKQLDRDARELFTSLESSFTELGGLKREIAHWGIAPIMLVQKSVNAITWYAAREQALEQGHADPAAYADAVVSMTQTGGGAKDLAAVQRGGELRKLFTVMFSYRSVLYNQLTERTGKTGEKALFEHAARFWWLVFLPVVVEQLVMNGVADDEDADDVAKRLALEMALLPASTIPWAGGVAEAAIESREPTAAPWLTTAYRSAVAAGKVVKGDDLKQRDVRAVVDLVGATLQLPTAAAWNYGLYLDGLLSGELEEPVQDLLFRNPSRWE